MFTRRMLFKILAAVGGGSLFSAAGEAVAAQCFRVSAASCFGHLAKAGESSELHAQTLDVTAIERWENLLDDLDGVELIGRYVSLEPYPDDVSRLTGRCPFCRHGADSLLVDARDDSYLCTDCLADGHVLDFYARLEGISLSESVSRMTRLLASGEFRGKQVRRKRFQCLINEITSFARESLICTREGALARGWLEQQSVTPETAERFSLGVMS